MKEKIKGLLSGVVTACVVALTIGTVLAATNGSVLFNSVNLRHNGQQISAKGENFTLDSGASVPASILYTDENGGGTTYLPIARICRLLDVEISWDGSTGSVLIGSETTNLKLNHDVYYLKPNETLTLQAIDADSGHVVNDVTWSIVGEDASRFISLKNGSVSELESGWARYIIVATTANGVSASCDIISDQTYTGLIRTTGSKTVYTNFPSILSIDNVVPDAHFWSENEISYPQFDIYSYYYCYQAETLAEAEANTKAYARYLEKQGYTLVREEDNPMIKQDFGSDIIYELISPDDVYRIEITNDHWATFWYNSEQHYYYSYRVSIDYNF